MADDGGVSADGVGEAGVEAHEAGSGEAEVGVEAVCVGRGGDGGEVEPVVVEDALADAQHVFGSDGFDALEGFVGGEQLGSEELLGGVPLGDAGRVLEAEYGAALE